MTASRRQALTERQSTHSVGNRLMRGVWGLVQTTLFRLSPRPFHRWRNWLLRLFGARLHPTARVYPRARIWAPWNLQMGAYATIGEDVRDPGKNRWFRRGRPGAGPRTLPVRG